MKKLYIKTRLAKDTIGVVHFQVYISKKNLELTENKNVTLGAGWYSLNEAPCTPGCPPPTVNGYWDCIGGQCVYFPY